MDVATSTKVVRTKSKIAIQGAAKATEAFTLVEIMIVVAIIGLLAALALPSMQKARKQSQGERILNDARQLSSAVDQWAVDTFRKDGDTIDTVQVETYLKTGVWPTKDLLGNTFRVSTVGSNSVQISRRTKNRLIGVGIDWGAY